MMLGNIGRKSYYFQHLQLASWVIIGPFIKWILLLIRDLAMAWILFY